MLLNRIFSTHSTQKGLLIFATFSKHWVLKINMMNTYLNLYY